MTPKILSRVSATLQRTTNASEVLSADTKILSVNSNTVERKRRNLVIDNSITIGNPKKGFSNAELR